MLKKYITFMKWSYPYIFFGRKHSDPLLYSLKALNEYIDVLDDFLRVVIPNLLSEKSLKKEGK